MKTENNMVRYVYLRTKPSSGQRRGNPVGCVAYQVEKSGSALDVRYATSTLHPTDDWDRAKAKMIASARLAKKPRQLHNVSDSLDAVMVDICIDLFKNSKTPTRLRNAALNRLEASPVTEQNNVEKTLPQQKSA